MLQKNSDDRDKTYASIIIERFQSLKYAFATFRIPQLVRCKQRSN